jgi:hypothetical protein
MRALLAFRELLLPFQALLDLKLRSSIKCVSIYCCPRGSGSDPILIRKVYIDPTNFQIHFPTYRSQAAGPTVIYEMLETVLGVTDSLYINPATHLT